MAETRFKKLDLVPDQFIIQCDNCGLVTRSPSLFSPEFDHSAKVSVRQDSDFIGGATEHIASHIKDRLSYAGGVVEEKTMLDIGCGSGALLVYAKANGWTVYGTEREKSSIEKLAGYNIPCFAGELNEPEFQKLKFDFVHMNHVLEHVIDPVEVVRNIQGLLKKGGISIIEVPNEFSAATQLLRRSLGLDGSSRTTYFQHEWFFTPKTLLDVCNRADLEILSLSTPFRRSNGFLKDCLRFPAAKAGFGEVIEIYLAKKNA